MFYYWTVSRFIHKYCRMSIQNLKKLLLFLLRQMRYDPRINTLTRAHLFTFFLIYNLYYTKFLILINNYRTAIDHCLFESFMAPLDLISVSMSLFSLYFYYIGIWVFNLDHGCRSLPSTIKFRTTKIWC